MEVVSRDKRGWTLRVLVDHDRSRPKRERSNANQTQLHLSAGNGHLEIVKPLLECGPDVLALNDQALRGRNTIRNIAGIWFSILFREYGKDRARSEGLLWLKCDV